MKKVLATAVLLSSVGFASGDNTSNVLVSGDNIHNEGFYLGAGIAAMSSRLSSVSRDIFNTKDGQDRLGNMLVTAGYTITNYLSVEGRYGFNITDEDQVTMDSQWSLFLKPIYKFENEEDQANGKNYFAIYGLLGYGGIDIVGTNNVNADISESGLNWGVGFSYTFRETARSGLSQYKDSWTIFADYTMLGADMDGLYYTGDAKVDADAFTVGLIYNF